MIQDTGSQPTALADNIMHFGRFLRAAGLPIDTTEIIDAVNAVKAIGVTRRSCFYWALHAAFVKRPAEREIFDQAFAVFWRDPDFLKRMMTLMMPQTRIMSQGVVYEAGFMSRSVSAGVCRL